MSAELDVRKRRLSLNVPLELAKKVEKGFTRPQDNGKTMTAYIRALEEATRDITLTKSDYKFIGDQVEENMKARMAKRQEKAKQR